MPRYDEVSDPSGCIRDAYSKLLETPPKSTTVSRGRTWSLFPNKSTTFKVSSVVLTIFAGLLVAGIVVAAKAHAWKPLAKVLTATGGAGSVIPLIFTILSSRNVSKPKATKRTPKKTRSPKKHSRANRERFRPQTLNRSSSTSATGSPAPLTPSLNLPGETSVFSAKIPEYFKEDSRTRLHEIRRLSANEAIIVLKSTIFIRHPHILPAEHVIRFATDLKYGYGPGTAFYESLTRDQKSKFVELTSQVNEPLLRNRPTLEAVQQTVAKLFPG